MADVVLNRRQIPVESVKVGQREYYGYVGVDPQRRSQAGCERKMVYGSGLHRSILRPRSEGGSGVKEAFLSTNKGRERCGRGQHPGYAQGRKIFSGYRENGTYYLITIDNVGNRAEELVGTVGTIDFTAPVIGQRDA